MITLGPINDKSRVEKIFKERNLAFTQYSGCVAAECSEEVLGVCLYELTPDKMTVLYIEPIGDIALADGILRSTLHVAAERSIMSAFYAETVSEDFLNKIGFIKNAQEKSLEIDKLFKSCCSCG